MTAEEGDEGARRPLALPRIETLDKERAEAARRLLAALQLCNLDDRYAAVLGDLRG